MWFSIVTASAAVLQVGPGQTYTTVEAAVSAANSGDEIRIAPGVYPVTNMQWSSDDLTIVADQGAGTVTLQMTENDRVFRVNNGSLTLVDIDFDGQDLGWLYDGNGSGFTCTGGTYSNGTHQGDGGLIKVSGAPVVIDGCTLRASNASGRGGFVHAGDTLTVTNSQFLEGSAGGEGGALYATGLTTLDGATFGDNGGTDGGAVYAAGGATVSSSTFFNSTGDLGTLYCNGVCSVVDTAFQGNTATRGAGVVFEGNGAKALTNVSWCANSGAALVDHQQGTLTAGQLVFFDNAVTDGTIEVASGATANIAGAHLVANTASVAASALRVRGTVDLRNALIAYNNGPGAAVVVTGGSLTAEYNLYFSNTASDSDQALDATEISGVDPLLQGVTTGACNFAQLVPFGGSPLIDAGDPALQDPDASRSDIGGLSDVDPPDIIDVDGDGSPFPLDCDDTNPNVSPDAVEVDCNNIDDDCDPTTLDSDDIDGDGVGVCSGDCDDNDAARFPGNPEVGCNGIDDDCNAATLDAGDGDGDGVDVCNGDCDDANPNRFPGNPEVICNGIDDDCDPVTVDSDDNDGDGVQQCSGDCDDNDPNRYPGNPEVTCNGIDEDCDAATLDDGDVDADGVTFCNGDCDDGNAAISPALAEVGCNDLDDDCDPSTPDVGDNDLDGVGVCEGDCDDSDPERFPGNAEVPYDDIDQDCSGEDANDLDGDGSPFPRDCDDADASINPRAEEVNDDGIDQNCDGNDRIATLNGRNGFDCGCSATGSPWGPMALLLGIVALRRRRYA